MPVIAQKLNIFFDTWVIVSLVLKRCTILIILFGEIYFPQMQDVKTARIVTTGSQIQSSGGTSPTGILE